MNKRVFTLLLGCLFAATLFAQNVPMAIPYQAVLRNAAGGILVDQSVNIRFAIHKNSTSGTTVFQEKHAVFTAKHGLVNVVIGFGTAEIGSFSAVDWPNGPYFLEVLLDDGSGWKSLGTTQFLSVPFALVAQKVIEKDTATGGGPTGPIKKIQDGDDNTTVEAEKYPNEDILRFTVNGIERWEMQGNNLQQVNSGKSIFIGEEAGLKQVMDADRFNTFVGYKAGKSNTTGINNTVVGAEAGSNNEMTGACNTFIGAGAGAVTDVGYVNVFVGEGAGFGNKSGAANTYIGQLAGFSGDNAAYNTFLGRAAGKNVISGQHNVYIGRAAGQENIAGSYNVYIGESAGFKELSGNRNLIIETDTGQVAPLVWGDFAGRRLGVNRKALTNAFEVNGEASKGSPGSWLGNSDRRLKTDILPLDPNESLQKMLALHGVSFEWDDKTTGSIRPAGRQIGFIAQEMQPVFPDLVKTDAQGYLQTSYGTFDPMLVESIRAVVARLEKVEAENVELKKQAAEIEQIKAEIRAMKGH